MPLLFWSLPFIVLSGIFETYAGGDESAMGVVRQKAGKPSPRRDSRHMKQVPF